MVISSCVRTVSRKNVDVLFVIPPVNKRWSDYTGLSQDMLQQVARKLKYQLQEQGFTNIADFSTCSNERYFMADTIHLGWRGWLAVDRQVDEFMKQPASKKLAYQIDDRFIRQIGNNKIHWSYLNFKKARWIKYQLSEAD